MRVWAGPEAMLAPGLVDESLVAGIMSFHGSLIPASPEAAQRKQA